VIIECGMSQMFVKAKLADLVDRVKPDMPRQRETGLAESPQRSLGRRVGCITSLTTSTTSTARCGPACQVVWEGAVAIDRPLSRYWCNHNYIKVLNEIRLLL
jgi:hypothetical protein